MKAVFFGTRRRTFASLLLSANLGLSGCATLPVGGPSTSSVNKAAGQAAGDSQIMIVDVSDAMSRRLKAFDTQASFSNVFGDAPAYDTVVGKGDGLEVSIWEAPPAVLFSAAAMGNTNNQAIAATNAATTRPNDLPQQVVGSDGRISIPFAGSVLAAGRTPEEIANEIRSRLQDKAHDPQVIVRLASNVASDVTVVGEVANSVRMPLSAKGERLLDALAGAGGVKQPVGKMTIQITRGSIVQAMPLEVVIRDPRQNIRLQAGDVVTLLFQPYSFVALGAARANQEISFEGTGLTLSQALGRMGGIDDQRASPKGVFIFRFEDAKLAAEAGQPIPSTTKDGKIPIIYRVNMRDPKTLFVAQTFAIKDKDIIYISNAPLADFSKFLQAVSQIVFPIATIQNANIF